MGLSIFVVFSTWWSGKPYCWRFTECKT